MGGFSGELVTAARRLSAISCTAPRYSVTVALCCFATDLSWLALITPRTVTYLPPRWSAVDFVSEPLEVAAEQRVEKNYAARTVGCRVKKLDGNLVADVVYAYLTAAAVHLHGATGYLGLRFDCDGNCRSVDKRPEKAVLHAAANGGKTRRNVVDGVLQFHGVNGVAKKSGHAKNADAFAPCHKRVHQRGVVQLVPFFVVALQVGNGGKFLRKFNFFGNFGFAVGGAFCACCRSLVSTGDDVVLPFSAICASSVFVVLLSCSVVILC